MNKGVYFAMELLQSFTKKELKGLQAMVDCSYFNTEKKVMVLLNILLKKINTKENISEKDLCIIYNKLFGTQLMELNARQLSNVYAKMSMLYDLLQQFLMIEALQKSEKTKSYLLQEQLLDKKQYRNFKKFITAKRKSIQQEELNIEFYEHQFIIENGALTYAQMTNALDKQNIALAINSLTQYYLLQQLDLHLVDLYLDEISANHTADDAFYEVLQPLLNLPRFSEHPLLEVYQSVVELMKTKTEAAFFQLIGDLEEYDDAIPFKSKINFYNTLLNVCVLQIRKGKTEYNQHQFSIYKTMDTKNLLLIDNQIHITNLHNIVVVSCNAGEFNWAVQMVEKYYKYLPINLCDAVKHYNLGAIAYYQKDYQLAIDYLFPLPTINLSHDVNRRSLMIKSFYELDTEFLETTHTLLRSFEKYIREHKSLTGKSKTSYKNFIRCLINLYRIKHKVSKMKLKNLKQKLSAQKLNSNKSWLLEKIKVLE